MKKCQISLVKLTVTKLCFICSLMVGFYNMPVLAVVHFSLRPVFTRASWSMEIKAIKPICSKNRTYSKNKLTASKLSLSLFCTMMAGFYDQWPCFPKPRYHGNACLYYTSGGQLHHDVPNPVAITLVLVGVIATRTFIPQLPVSRYWGRSYSPQRPYPHRQLN